MWHAGCLEWGATREGWLFPSPCTAAASVVSPPTLLPIRYPHKLAALYHFCVVLLQCSESLLKQEFVTTNLTNAGRKEKTARNLES